MNNAILRNKGQFTIPATVREELELEENDTLTVVPLTKKTFLVTSKKLKTLEFFEKTAAYAKKTGITLEDALAELDEIRHGA